MFTDTLLKNVYYSVFCYVVHSHYSNHFKGGILYFSCSDVTNTAYFYEGGCCNVKHNPQNKIHTPK